MFDTIASIVTFENDPMALKKTIDSFLNTDLNVRLFVIDNSKNCGIKDMCNDKRIEYISNNKNLGFGKAHNIAIRKSAGKSKFFLVLNPDIYFSKGTIESLYDFMEKNEDVGLVLPKVLYPDGSPQYLCRLIPTPFDLIIKRLNLPFLRLITKKIEYRYELRFADYNRITDVPYLSGCFMFIRNGVFEKVGMFDDRFFMYMEDLDFSRRIHKHYRTVYFPEAIIYHGYSKESYKNFKILIYHIYSAVKYFNKWGWFFDKEREWINRQAIKKYA